MQDVQDEIEAELNSFTTVVDVTKCRLYKKNFGEFFSNQIEYAGAIILSRTDKAKPEKVEESVALLRKLKDVYKRQVCRRQSCRQVRLSWIWKGMSSTGIMP